MGGQEEQPNLVTVVLKPAPVPPRDVQSLSFGQSLLRVFISLNGTHPLYLVQA